MNRRLRSVLTATFTAGFLVAAPLVLLYTAGYKYDWRKQRIQKTGIIQTDSIPDEAAVFLNGRGTGRTTPAALGRLLPEEYRVRFEKPGYFPWEKTVEVRSGGTVFMTDAALVRDEPAKLVLEGAISRSAFSDDGARAAFVRETDGGSELVTFSLRDRLPTDEPVVLARYSPGAFTNALLLWSPDGRRLLTVAGDGKDREIISYDLADGGSVALHEDGSAALGADWSEDGTRAVIRATDGVYLTDPQDGSETLAVSAPNVRDAMMIGRSLYLLRSGADGVVLERRGTAPVEDGEAIATLPLGELTFLSSRSPYLLVRDGTRGRIIVVSTDDGEILATLSAAQAMWPEQTRDRRLLVCNDFEMTVADLEAGTRKLITRLGTRIDGCAWHPVGNAAFYAGGDAIHAIDLDAREPKNVNGLSEASGFSGFAADSTDEMLRFFGTVDGVTGLYERAY